MLVIIGLIVGGVLVGADLIQVAKIRGTISQIDRYNAAANAFRGKYGGIPGNLQAGLAAQFGFAARSGAKGQGSGNGVIEGWDVAGLVNNGTSESAGETSLFWVDITTTGLMSDGGFTTATSSTWLCGGGCVGNTIDNYFPRAKIGGYIYVWSYAGTNYFGLSNVTFIGGVTLIAGPNLTPLQSSSIDSKVDDGFPQTGSVLARYVSNYFDATYNPSWVIWAKGGGQNIPGPSDTSATPVTSSTCYDNGGTAGSPQQYSVATNGGLNCALSFRVQF